MPNKRLAALLLLLPGIVLILLGVSATMVNYGSQVRNGPMRSDAGVVGATLTSLCSGSGNWILSITQSWAAQSNQTLTCTLQPGGGVVQIASGQTLNLPCPISGPQQLFDFTSGGSLIFTKPCSGKVNMGMFAAQGTDWGLALQGVYNACAPMGGCQLDYPTGTFAHTTGLTLQAGVPVQISGQGTGSFTTSVVGTTILTYSGSGAWLNQNATDRTDNVSLHDFAYSCSAAGCQFAQIGSTSQDTDASLNRQSWEWHNLWIIGPSGSTLSTNPGLSLTQLVKCHFTNVLILDFYQNYLLDRSNGCRWDTVWEQNSTLDASITWKGGSGSGSGAPAEFVGVNLAFQGPNFGSGHCSLTVDDAFVKLIGTLYEPTVASSCWIHNTNQGHDFTEIGGALSGSGVTNSFIWDNSYTNIQMLGTSCPGTAMQCSSISAGTPANISYGAPATFLGVSASLYIECQAVGNSKCQAIGGTPISYGGYTAITGPVRMDVAGSGDALQMSLNKLGAVNDVIVHNFLVPSADGTGHTTIEVYSMTESTSGGNVAAGLGFNTGTQASVAQSLYLGSDGHVAMPRAATTGAASGKTVVCMDGSGQIYRSSSSSSCAN